MSKPGDSESNVAGSEAETRPHTRAVDREPPPVHVKLTHALGFATSAGSSGAVQRAVEHVSQEEVVYLTGKHVAIYNHENQTHSFILKQSKTADIMAYAVSANRRYIAIAERLLEEKAGNSGTAEVSVWNIGGWRGDAASAAAGGAAPAGGLQGGGGGVEEAWQAKKVRVLSFAYLSKQPVVALAFSRDNKFLATATLAPEACVYLWQLDKSPPKPLALSESLGNVRVGKITISPWNSDVLCATGTALFRFWRFVAPNQLKVTAPMAKQRDYRYTSHTWVDEDRVVVGTMEGDILITDNMELRRVLPAVHAENVAIWATEWVGRGFVCAGDGGNLSLFERTYDQDCFQLSTTRCYQTGSDKVKFVDMSVSPNEENVICLTDNNKLVLFNLANVDIVEVERGDSREGSVFRPLSVGFHGDTVTAVDVCIQRSIVVTCSLDRRVRIWNFMKKRVEVDKQFDEDAMCVACHPTGLRIITGFKYKISMFNVLLDDLHLCQDFPVKHCKELHFSQGGQYFAAAVVTKIFVFNTYNFCCVASLAGHQSMVKSLCWTQNDQFIVSAGFEGAIYEWRVETMMRTDTEHPVQKAIAYSCVRYDEDTQLAAVVGSNKVAEMGLQEGWVTLRTLRVGEDTDGKQVKDKEWARPLQDPLLLCPGAPRNKPAHTRTHTVEVAVSSYHRALFVGTPTGQLHVYRWPLKEGEPPITQVAAHEGEVLFAVLSADEKWLFTVGEDNCLLMFSVEAVADEKSRMEDRRPKQLSFSTFEEVAYIRQTQLDESEAEVQRYGEENATLEKTQEHERARLIARHQREQVQKQEEAQKELSELKAAIAQSQAEREEILKAMAAKRDDQERQHMVAAEKLELHYKNRTEEMQRRFQELKDEKDDMIVRYDNMISMLERQCTAEEDRLENELQVIKETMEGDIAVLKKERKEQDEDLVELLNECEGQFEEQVREMKQQFEEINAEKEQELTICRRKRSDKLAKEEGHHQKIKRAREESTDKGERVNKLKQKNKEYEKTNDALRLEIQVRNDNIAASEKKILELRKQTAELEKLKYVLFFKFNELRKEVNPKEEQIAVMNERTDEMLHELQKIRDDRETLRQALAGKNDKISVIQRETGSRREVLDSKEKLIRSLLNDLQGLLSKGDLKGLVYELRDVVTDYARRYDTDECVEGRAGSHEFHRQRAHIEKRLSTAEKQNDRRRDNLQKDNQRKTSENTTLVREVNDLRHEKKNVLARTLKVEEQVKEARSALAKAQGQQAPGAHAAGRGSHPSPTREEGATPAFNTAQRPSTAGAVQHRTGTPSKPRTLSSSRLREITSLDPVRIAAIIQQVERNNAEMLRQQEEIQRLRDFVSHLLTRADMEADLTAAQQSENAEIRKQLGLPRSGTDMSKHDSAPEERKSPATSALPRVRPGSASPAPVT